MQPSAPASTLRAPRWRWLDDGLFPLILSGMRVCWLAPWLVGIGAVLAPDEPEAVLSGWLILLLPVLSLTLARQWVRPDRAHADVGAPQISIPWTARLGVAAGGLLIMLLVLWWQVYRPNFNLMDPAWLNRLGDELIHWSGTSVPAPVLISLSTLMLWMAGLRDAPKKFVHDDVWRAFGVGIVALAIYIILVRLVGAELPITIGANVLWLLGLGMTGLAFTSLKVTAGLDRALGAGPRRMAATPGVNLHWLGSVIAVIGALLLGGFLLGSIVSPDVLAAVMQAGSAVLTFLGRIVAFILLGIAYGLLVIGYYIALWLAPLVQRLFGERFAEMEEMLMAPQEQQTMQELQETATAPIPDSYRWIGVIVITLLVALAFALTLRRLSALSEEEDEETRESVFSAQLLEEQLGSLWNNLRQRWGAASQMNPFLSLDGETATRRQIREAYQQMLRATLAAGSSRTPSWTPREYAHHLQTHSALTDAEAHSALQDLTEAYLQARYAAEIPSSAAAEHAERASAQIETRIHPKEITADDEMK